MATFSAAPGTPSFCALGESFEFLVDMDLQSNSPDRYDVGFFFGQNGNDPTTSSAADKCSVAVYPTTPPPGLADPWFNADGNTCADFRGYGSIVTTIDKIKVLCQGSSTGSLQIPYTLVYSQNSYAGSCSGTGDVQPGSPSKCQGTVATVTSGGVGISTLAHVDVTKQTTPDGDGQAFSFTATGPAGSKVIAGVQDASGNWNYTDIASATNTVTYNTLTDGQTVRFAINATSANKTLTITEAANSNWENTAAISCSPVTGSPGLTTNNVTRTISATLNTTDSAAACTVSNTKKATVTLQKNIAARIAAGDQFGLTVTDGTTPVTVTTSGSGTGVQAATATKIVAGGTPLTISEAAAGTTNLNQYASTISCTNTNAGSGTVLPNGSGTSFSVTPAAGDNITCTILNTPLPGIVTLRKNVAARVGTGDQFRLTVTDGTTPVTATTSGSSTGLQAATATKSVAGGTPLTVSEAAAGTTRLNQYAASIACTNATAGSGTALPSGIGTSFGVTPMPGDNITCTILNTPLPGTVTLQKNVAARVGTGDQFRLTVTDGTTPVTATTSGSSTGLQAATATKNVAGGTALTVSEAAAGTTNLNQYVSTISCTNATAGSGTVLPSGNGTSLGVTPVAGDNITCTITNTPKPASITLRTTWSNAILNDAVNVTATGLTTLSSTANSTNETDSGTTQSVFIGSVVTLDETFTTGLAANYTQALSCTGTSGLVGNVLTIGVTDTNIVCTYTNTRKTANLTLQKTWSNAIVSDSVNVTATGLTTLNSVANTASETDTGGVQAVRAGDVITIGETFTVGSAANYGSALSCSGNSTPLAGNVLTVNAADTNIVCTYTNTRRTLTLQKSWVRAISGNAVNVTATGLTTLSSTAGATDKTDSGTSQTVHAGDVITLAESFTSGSSANYNQSLSCTGNTAPLSGNLLTVNAADGNIVCTYTNTRKTVNLTMQKTWVNALVNDAVNVTATGLTTLNSVANTPGETDAGGVQTVGAGDVITFGESFTVGTAANYTQTLSCTGTAGLAGNVLTVGAADTNIVCTYTNTRKTATVTLRKTWVNALVNNAADVTATGLTTLNSVANSANETDAGSAQTIFVGSVLTLGETFTTGSGANYTSALSCTGTTGLAGTTLTVGSGDTAIVCTYTNTRKTATVTLRKTWVNALVNNAVNVTATGLTTLNSVANTASETDAGGAQTVRAGDVITIGETFTAGSAANYNSTLSCSGNTTPLAGNVLTVNSADAAITCTYTNTRKTATVTLRKTWANAIVNDAVNVTATGLTTLNSVANTASETDAGGAQTVRAGDVITIGETFTAGSVANYTSTLSCSGNTTPLAGNVLTVNSADAAITCTYTNTRKTATVTLRKTWVNAIVNDAVNVTATGLTGLNSVANTASETDAGGAQTVRAGDVITIGETFTVGSAANYTSTLSCSGNTTPLAGNILTVNSADAAITCTYTNTRKSANLTLRKTWANAIINDAVNVTATGLTTLNSVANTASETDAAGAQTVRAGDVITITEAFTVGTAANYTQTLSCTGTAGLSGNVLTVGSVDTDIVCTYVNTRKTATVTLRKTWVNALVNDAVNVTATGLTTLSSVANSANETDAGGAQPVRAGDVITIGETFTVGSAANYTSTLSCSGNITPLAGNVLTVDGADTTITCSMTNTNNGVAVSGTIYSDANHNGLQDGGEAGTGQTVLVKLAPRSGGTCGSPSTFAAAADPSTGIFTVPSVTAGDYCLIISTNATLSDIAPAWPAGWIPTETPTGIRAITVAASPLTGQNFGMYNGGRLSGRVFSDTGVGGGTPNDGLQQGSEAGLGGVTVRVTNSGGGTVYDSTTTSGSGDYTLWLPAAAGNTALKVVETNPNGYISTGGGGGTYDRATDSIIFTNSVGTTYSGFTFADVPVNAFVANNSRSIVPGGVMFYPHTFTAGTGGQLTFATSSLASPAISGWSEVFYADSNCNGTLDLGEPQITGPITTTAGQQVCILVKDFAPANAPPNATNTVTVSAIFGYTNSSLPPGILTVTDVSTVVQVGLTLLKQVDKAAALPGETLLYTITYVNTGFSPLTNIVINDNVPTYTSLVSPSSSSACCVGPSDCLGTPATSYPPSISSCTILTTPSAVSWTLTGTLNPGASGQVKFIVKIDN